MPGTLCSLGRNSWMISSADRLRSPRFFSLSSMLPVLVPVRGPPPDPTDDTTDCDIGIALGDVGQLALHPAHGVERDAVGRFGGDLDLAGIHGRNEILLGDIEQHHRRHQAGREQRP